MLPFYQWLKYKRKNFQRKKIIKAAQATAHTAVETLPPTRSGRSGLPFQVVCPAGAPHRSEAPKAAVGTQTSTTLVSNLTPHLPRFPAVCSPQTHLYVLSAPDPALSSRTGAEFQTSTCLACPAMQVINL